MIVNWYNNTDDKRTLHKNPSLLATDSDSIIYGDTSILYPTLKCKTYAGNYVYISQFDRYYFITNVILSKGYYYISCAIDALYSNENNINALNVLVVRSEDRDKSIPDNAIPFRTNKFVRTQSFGEDIISNSTMYYVIGVI